MRRARRPLVGLYALGAALAVVTCAALTSLVLRQQAAHDRAVAEALYHEDVRTALWRMETRVAGMLALTTTRLGAGDAATSWNTLGLLYNGVAPSAAPPEALRSELIAAADRAFELACNLDPFAEQPLPPAEAAAPPRNWVANQQDLVNRGLERSAEEFERRSLLNMTQQQGVTNVATEEGLGFCVGPLAPCWDRTSGTLGLQLARRVVSPAGVTHESYRLEWAELSGLLLDEVRDLFPEAALAPIEAEDAGPSGADRATRLAAIPARLIVPPPRPAEGLPRTHLWTLAGTWVALSFALVVGGLALRASYAYGDKHRRFTQAVTHELRTPLTTFRMYSEMLARGMVPDGARADYLATLESESARLARLVDNVLRYARLEEGRPGAPTTRLTANALVLRCAPELARTCANYGARLELQEESGAESGAESVLETDPEAVLQVLSNLVENACKYGQPRDDAASFTVGLHVHRAPRELCIDIVDAGPGVPTAVRRSIFEPFERGGRDSSDPAPGVGLGLALARALAEELGGRLVLLDSERGARFRLTLPLRAE